MWSCYLFMFRVIKVLCIEALLTKNEFETIKRARHFSGIVNLTAPVDNINNYYGTIS